MIIPRRPGRLLAYHPDGRAGEVLHPQPTGALVYVRISPYVTANWKRTEMRFRRAA